jgi:hypothetical protein
MHLSKMVKIDFYYFNKKITLQYKVENENDITLKGKWYIYYFVFICNSSYKFCKLNNKFLLWVAFVYCAKHFSSYFLNTLKENKLLYNKNEVLVILITLTKKRKKKGLNILAVSLTLADSLWIPSSWVITIPHVRLNILYFIPYILCITFSHRGITILTINN